MVSYLDTTSIMSWLPSDSKQSLVDIHSASDPSWFAPLKTLSLSSPRVMRALLGNRTSKRLRSGPDCYDGDDDENNYNNNNNNKNITNNSNSDVHDDEECVLFKVSEAIEQFHVCNCDNLSTHNANIVENCPLHQQAMKARNQTQLYGTVNTVSPDPSTIADLSATTPQSNTNANTNTATTTTEPEFYCHPLVAGVARGRLTAESRARAKLLLEGACYRPHIDYEQSEETCAVSTPTPTTFHSSTAVTPTSNNRPTNLNDTTPTPATCDSYHLPGLAPTVSDQGFINNDVFTKPLFKEDYVTTESTDATFNWDAFNSRHGSDHDKSDLETSQQHVAPVWTNNLHGGQRDCLVEASMYDSNDEPDEIYAWKSDSVDDNVYGTCMYSTATSLGWDGCYYGEITSHPNYDNDDDDDEIMYHCNPNLNYSDMV